MQQKPEPVQPGMVTLTMRHDQAVMLERLVTEGVESTVMTRVDEGRAEDILHIISDARRHAETTAAAPIVPNRRRLRR